MQLILYLGNDLIDSVSIDPAKITLPGNLGSYTRQLKAQYYQLIRQKKSCSNRLLRFKTGENIFARK